MPCKLPKYCVQDTDRHGNVRVYLRKRGIKKIRLNGQPWSQDFMAAYQRALQGETSSPPPSPDQLALWRRAKTRATKRRIPFTISPEDIPDIPLKCPVLGIPLHKAKGRPSASSPSLDRINNDRGYVPGNIAVISYRANSIKSNLSAKQISAFFDYVST